MSKTITENNKLTFNKFITKYFDQVYVINLDIRPDRMEQVDDLLSYYKINYKRISGVYLKDKYTDVINNMEILYIIFFILFGIVNVLKNHQFHHPILCQGWCFQN